MGKEGESGSCWQDEKESADEDAEKGTNDAFHYKTSKVSISF